MSRDRERCVNIAAVERFLREEADQDRWKSANLISAGNSIAATRQQN